MKQRVGIARALIMEPVILCMDEPFSALDVLTGETLRNEIGRIAMDSAGGLQKPRHRHPQYFRGGLSRAQHCGAGRASGPRAEDRSEPAPLPARSLHAAIPAARLADPRHPDQLRPPRRTDRGRAGNRDGRDGRGRSLRAAAQRESRRGHGPRANAEAGTGKHLRAGHASEEGFRHAALRHQGGGINRPRGNAGPIGAPDQGRHRLPESRRKAAQEDDARSAARPENFPSPLRQN